MTQKLVTTIRLDAEQLTFIKAEAKRLRISTGEVVRRIIDDAMEGEQPCSRNSS